MKKLPKFLCLFFCLLSGSELLAQDLIVKTNGAKLFCRIIAIDSVSIQYELLRDRSVGLIAKDSVEKYYYGRRNGSTTPVTTTTTVKKQSSVLNIQLFGGSSLPHGKFQSKDVTKDDSGLALDGYMLGAALTLKVAEEFGFEFSYVYQSNRFDALELQDALNSAIPNGGFTTEATPWKMRGFFVGTLIQINIKRITGLSFRITPRIGLPKYFQPSISSRGRINGIYVGLDTGGDPVRSVTFSGGVGMAYQLRKHMALTVDLDYFLAKPSFSGRHKNLFGYTEYFSFVQPYRTLCPRAGLLFLFGNNNRNL